MQYVKQIPFTFRNVWQPPRRCFLDPADFVEVLRRSRMAAMIGQLCRTATIWCDGRNENYEISDRRFTRPRTDGAGGRFGIGSSCSSALA